MGHFLGVEKRLFLIRGAEAAVTTGQPRRLNPVDPCPRGLPGVGSGRYYTRARAYTACAAASIIFGRFLSAAHAFLAIIGHDLLRRGPCGGQRVGLQLVESSTTGPKRLPLPCRSPPVVRARRHPRCRNSRKECRSRACPCKSGTGLEEYPPRARFLRLRRSLGRWPLFASRALGEH